MSDVQMTATGPRAQQSGTWRANLRVRVESAHFERFVIAVIVMNAVVLGLETSAWAMTHFGGLLFALDAVALAFFVAEILLKLTVYRFGYFRNAWNIFDFAIVAISLVPAGQGLTVLRSLRVMRALRLVSMLPKMRLVVQGLLGAIPAMGAVAAILTLVFYVFGVMATKLFSADFPVWFGTLGNSLFSLFQIMTLESWSMGIVRPVMEVYPYAWAFFVPFILIATFAVLNLFIAIIVNSMHNAANIPESPKDNGAEDLKREIVMLRNEMTTLRVQLQSPSQAPILQMTTGTKNCAAEPDHAR